MAQNASLDQLCSITHNGQHLCFRRHGLVTSVRVQIFESGNPAGTRQDSGGIEVEGPGKSSSAAHREWLVAATVSEYSTRAKAGVTIHVFTYQNPLVDQSERDGSQRYNKSSDSHADPINVSFGD